MHNSDHDTQDDAPTPARMPKDQNAADPDGGGHDLESKIRERLHNAGIDTGLVGDRLTNGDLVIVNELIFNVKTLQAEVEQLRTSNAILSRKIQSNKRTFDDSENEALRPNKRHEGHRLVGAEHNAGIRGTETSRWSEYDTDAIPPIATEKLHAITGVRVPGKLHPTPKIVRDPSLATTMSTGDTVAAVEEDKSDTESDDEFEASGKRRTQHEMRARASARRARQERQDKLARDAAEAKRRRDLELVGKIPDIFGVIIIPHQMPQRDNSLMGMAYANTYVSQRSNAVYVRSTAISAEHWEHTQPSAFRPKWHPIYDKVPLGLPRNPLEVSYLITMTQETRNMQPWQRIEAYTLLDELRTVASRVTEENRDRAMIYLMKINPASFIPDLPEKYWIKVDPPRDPRRMKLASRDLTAIMPPNHQLLEIDEMARYALLHARPRGTTPFTGIIMDLMMRVDRRSIFGIGMARMLGPNDRAVRAAFTRGFAFLAAHSNRYREGIAVFNDKNPTNPFKPQRGPTYKFMRCDIPPSHARNLSIDNIINVLLINGIPPEWVDHAYNFGYQYMNQKYSGSNIDDALLADMDDERLRRLDKFGKPPSIPAWGGWRYATDDDRMRLMLLMEREEAMPKPHFSLRHPAWRLAGQQLTSRYLNHRPQSSIDEYRARVALPPTLTHPVEPANAAQIIEPDGESLGDNTPTGQPMDLTPDHRGDEYGTDAIDERLDYGEPPTSPSESSEHGA
ncbi:hypothetical protein CVT25_003734 [Psilocybe cyanescens]|uniref:Uncharacterized protein n=1 Tax=Psilocybe cyanescens TaxID=93625 RepID=A0A409XKP1_PSICY|nr:hypothetical protein CVT25_003734 [Psilocybe cyanescens]